MNKSPTLHPSRSYNRSLGRFCMTGGLVATLDGSTTNTNKLQTRQTLSTNYTEHTRLSYFASEHTIHDWTQTYIASRENSQQSVSTAPTVVRPLNISCSTAHCTTTSQIQTTANSTKYILCHPWTDVTRLSEVWGTKKGKKSTTVTYLPRVGSSTEDCNLQCKNISKRRARARTGRRTERKHEMERDMAFIYFLLSTLSILFKIFSANRQWPEAQIVTAILLSRLRSQSRSPSPRFWQNAVAIYCGLRIPSVGDRDRSPEFG